MDFLHKRLYAYAKKRAMRDPEYAAEELGRRREKTYIIGSGEGYTLEGFFEHMERFRELNPWWDTYTNIRYRAGQIKRFPKRVKWFIQRGRRGYSDEDLWNLSYYIARIISDGSTHLRNIAHGFPVDLDDHGDQMTFDQWQRELTMIAEGFKTDEYDDLNIDDATWARLQRWFPAMWD